MKSAVGFAAVENSADFYHVLGSGEEEPVIPDAKPQIIPPMKCLNVAFARFSETVQSRKDAHCGGLVETAHIVPWLVRSRRSASSFSVIAVDFFLSDSKFRQDLLVGNGLIVLQPLASFVERLNLFLADRLVFDGSISDGASNRIGHHFQQTDDSIQLSGIEPFHQFVRVLFLLGGRHHGVVYQVRG